MFAILATLPIGLYLIAAGMFFSLAFSSTRKAYMMTLLAAIFFIALLPLGSELISLVDRGAGRDFYKFAISINPYGQLEIFWSRGSSSGKMWESLALGTFIYGGLGIALLAMIRANFDTLARRTL